MVKFFNLVVVLYIDELLRRLEGTHIVLDVKYRHVLPGLLHMLMIIIMLLIILGRQLQFVLDLCINFGKECVLSYNVKTPLWSFVGILIVNIKYPQLRFNLSDLLRAD